MKKAIITNSIPLPPNVHIPLPSAPPPQPKLSIQPPPAPPIDEPSSSNCQPTALTSPITLTTLQGICVFQLPFPGVLADKDQREKLSTVVKKYSKNFEIRFDAVPNPDHPANSQQQTSIGGRRFQPNPLIRRALIVIQKLANSEPLLNELNRLTMVGCQLKASMATPEDLSSFIATRAAKSSLLLSKVQLPPPPTIITDFTAKRPQNLLRLPIISPPAAAVKAMIFDAQNHGMPDPFSKNSSRFLYIKHLETNITEEELKGRYGKYGHILDIEVKNKNTMAPYAFIQFTNIESVCKAIRQSNQQQIEDNTARQKKSTSHHWWGNTIVSNRLWVGLLPPKCGEQYLASKVRVVLTSPEHDITKVDYDPAFNEAVLIFTGHEAAQIVFNKIKMGQIKFQPESSIPIASTAQQNKHVHVDFCSEKLHSYFVDRLFHKSVEIAAMNQDAAISGLLPSPPEQPKLPSMHSLKKASPSPPPDPSSEFIERRQSISVHSYSRPSTTATTNKLAHQQSTSSIISVAEQAVVITNKQQQYRTGTVTVPEAIKEEQSAVTTTIAQHSKINKKEGIATGTMKKQQQERRGTGTSTVSNSGNNRQNRSTSASSESSTDTYNMRKSRHHSQSKHHSKEGYRQHVDSVEHSHGDHGSSTSSHQRKKQQPAKHLRKHQSQQSNEAPVIKYRGKSWERRNLHSHHSAERRKETTVTERVRTGHREMDRRPRKHEPTRKTGEEKRTFRSEYDKSESKKKLIKKKTESSAGRTGINNNRSAGADHHRLKVKARSSSDARPISSLLPPPPLPPIRMDKVAEEQSSLGKASLTKQRSTSSYSSCSNSSCSSYSDSESCSTCSFNEESPTRRNQPNKEDDNESNAGSGSSTSQSSSGRNHNRRHPKQKEQQQQKPLLQHPIKVNEEECTGGNEICTTANSNENEDNKKLLQNIKQKTKQLSVERTTDKLIATDNHEKSSSTEMPIHPPIVQLEKHSSLPMQRTERTDSINSELAHKKTSATDPMHSSSAGPGTSQSTCSLTARLKTLIRTHVNIPLTPDPSHQLTDPRKQKATETHESQSLELPRFALRLKLPKRIAEMADSGNSQQQQLGRQQTTPITAGQMKQLKKDESCFNYSQYHPELPIILGTPISATPTVFKQEPLHSEFEQQELKKHQNVKEEMIKTSNQKSPHHQPIQHPSALNSFTTANNLLQKLYEGIEARRAVLNLDKLLIGKETNIQKMQHEMQQQLELLRSGSTTALHDHSIATSRSGSSSFHQNNSHTESLLHKRSTTVEMMMETTTTATELSKIETEELPQEEFNRPRTPIGCSGLFSSFSNEQRHNNEPQSASQIQNQSSSDLYERRNTLPAKVVTETSATKQKVQISRPRASSSSVSHSTDECTTSPHSSKAPEMGSPIAQRPSSFSKFIKPKVEKEENVVAKSHPLKKATSAIMLKKPSPTTSGMAATNSPNAILDKEKQQEKQQNKHISTAKSTLMNALHNTSKPLIEHRKSSHQTPPKTKIPSTASSELRKAEDKEKSLVKKEHHREHKDKETKTKHQQMDQKETTSSGSVAKIPHNLSASKEGKRKDDGEKIKKFSNIFSSNKESKSSSSLKQHKSSAEMDATTTDSDKKKKRKKRKRQEDTSSSEDEEEQEAIAGLFDIDFEEQRKMMEAIKSGKPYGMSMYDRVKRRSQRPADDEKKKATALEQLREKHTKKKKELNRVQLDTNSSDTDGSKDTAKHSSVSHSSKPSTVVEKQQKSNTAAKQTDQELSDMDEDVDVDVVDDSNKFTLKDDIIKNEVDEPQHKQPIEESFPMKPRKPEIAPKKPMMMEKHEEEDEEAGATKSKTTISFSSSGEWLSVTSGDGDDDEAENSAKLSDKIIQKLKVEFDRHRSNSQSSRDEQQRGDLDKKIARVVDIAKEGQQQETEEHSDDGEISSRASSSDSNSSSSSTDENEEKNVPKGFPIFKKRAPKETKSTFMADVFGEDSSDEIETPIEEMNVTKQKEISPLQKREEKATPVKVKQSTTSAEKSNEIPPIKHFKPSKEEKSEAKKDRKANYPLQQKQAPTTTMAKEIHTGTKQKLEPKKLLKRQTPVRSISNEPSEEHGKHENREDHHHAKTIPKRAKKETTTIGQISPSPVAKRRKSMGTVEKMIPDKLKTLAKSEKRPQLSDVEKEGKKTAKRPKLDMPISKMTPHEKETSPKFPESSKKEASQKLLHGTTPTASTMTEQQKKSELMDSEMDAIGLLGIVPSVAIDGLEVIDSGKVASNSGESAAEDKKGQLDENKKESEPNEDECQKKEKKDNNSKKEEEEEKKAEMLRRMEQNEEEEAVAALKMPTMGRRSSQDMDDSNSSMGSFMKPIEHQWPPMIDKLGAVVDKEEPKPKQAAEMEAENRPNDEKAVEEVKRKEKESGNIQSMEQTHQSTVVHEQVERRPSNESIDAQMVGIGSGFVEVDAEVLKEQQEKEQLAEERRKREEAEHKKREEAKRLEATVDFVVANNAVSDAATSSAAAVAVTDSTSSNAQNLTAQFKQVPPPPDFAPMPTEFIVKIQPDHQQQQQQQHHHLPVATSLNLQNIHDQQSQNYKNNKTAISIPPQPQHHQQKPVMEQNVQQPTNLNQLQQLQSQQQHQKTPTKQLNHRIGVIVSEAYTHQPTSSIVDTATDTTVVTTTSIMPNQPQTTNIYANLADQQQKLAHDYFLSNQQLLQQQQSMSLATSRSLTAQENAAYSAPTTSTPNLFVQAFEQQQQSNLFMLQQQQQQQQQQLYDHSKQINAPQKIIQQQQKLPEKKLSVQPPPQPQQPAEKKASIQPQPSQQYAAAHQQQNIQQQKLWQNQIGGQIAHQQVAHSLHQQQQPTPQPNYQQQQNTQTVKQQQQVRIQQQQQHTIDQPKQQQQTAAQRQVIQEQRQSHIIQQQQQAQQQAQQQQQKLQQAQHADQLAAAAAAAVAHSHSGLDSTQMLQLYQTLMLSGREHPQMLQQVPNLSAAMMAAAASSNQLNSSNLAKWQSLSTALSNQTAAMNNSNTIEELLRQTGLLSTGHQQLGIPTTTTPSALSAMPHSQNTAMTANTLEELYRQQYMATNSSPRLQPQQPQLAALSQSQTQQSSHSQQQNHEQILAQRHRPQTITAAASAQQSSHQQQHHQPTHRTQIPPIFPSNPTQQTQQSQQQESRPQQTNVTHTQSSQQIPTQPIVNQQQQKLQTQMAQAQQQNQPPPQHHQIQQHPLQLQNTVEQQQQQQNIQKQNAHAAPVWQGQLAMKNADTLVLMHKVCGNEQLIARMNRELVTSNDQGIPLLRITQRMRLEQSQIDSVIRKMEQDENYIALICFPCGRDRNDVKIQTDKMRQAFIEYFSSKQAAGIASSPPHSCVAHIFAPDDFIRGLLAKNAPDILAKVEMCKAGYLFVILTNS